ncbi:hypothetical protein STEG23_020110, partial [Scotinomys teguina]
LNPSTVMATALPRTLGELQLYRILQKANLLSYFDAFIQQGGDDVQQLCEAGEEEFLEIMALVGMASKPLHVRRLQKALRDWVTNPGLFNQPLTSLPVSSIPIYKLPEGSPTWLGISCNSFERSNSARDPHLKIPKCAATTCVQSLGQGKSEVGSLALQSVSESRLWQGHHATESEHSLSPADLGSPASPKESSEALDAAAALSVAECVERMAATLPKSDLNEVKELLKNNKKLAKMIGHIFEMSDEDPHKEEEIRKYSAIYGRFDSKRKDGKHLTLHELTVNEAAAQLCVKDNALLTRRDELFALARQVSREVTYKYTYRTTRLKCGERDELSPKRIKVEMVSQFNHTTHQENGKEKILVDLAAAAAAAAGDGDGDDDGDDGDGDGDEEQVKADTSACAVGSLNPDGFPDFQESVHTMFQQARAKSEELAALGSQQAEKGMAKQMELLCAQARYERLQQERRLTAGLYRQSSGEHSPDGLPSDGSDGQGERPLNLRMPDVQNRQAHHFVVDGELSRLYSSEAKSHSSVLKYLVWPSVMPVFSRSLKAEVGIPILLEVAVVVSLHSQISWLSSDVNVSAYSEGAKYTPPWHIDNGELKVHEKQQVADFTGFFVSLRPLDESVCFSPVILLCQFNSQAQIQKNFPTTDIKKIKIFKELKQQMLGATVIGGKGSGVAKQIQITVLREETKKLNYIDDLPSASHSGKDR